MNILKNEVDNDEEIFNSLTDTEKNNKRVAVRYIRSDINVTFSKPGLLNLSKYIPVKLLDISSKGIAIEYKKKLPIKKKITLDFLFEDNKSFSITAKIIRRASNKIQYGLKFDHFNHELGDYLLYSQNDLIFK
jgi:hypothetical protein